MNDLSETETMRVFEVLKTRIIDKQIPPGMPLSHSQLCRELQTSRTPIREAIRKLEGLGFVQTVPHRGSFVAQLGLQDFLEITQIRALLEPFATRQAAGRVPDDVLDDLEQRLRSLDQERPTDQDFEALHIVDADIHRAIGRYAGNTRLNSMSEMLRTLCQQFSYDSRIRFGVMVGELRSLLTALRAGDADAAERIMHEHINNFSEALPRLMSR